MLPWTKRWAKEKKIRRSGVHSWLSCQISSCCNSQDALDSNPVGQKDTFPSLLYCK